MATTAAPASVHDRNSRRRPFSSWMKRLANLKSSSSNTNNTGPGIGLIKRNPTNTITKAKAAASQRNNPYPESGHLHKPAVPSLNGHLSFSTSRHIGSDSSLSPSRRSLESSVMGVHQPSRGARSAAPTISTNPDTTLSDVARSKAESSAAGTNVTVGGAMSSHGGGGSTFSSPAPSVRSLTTTLTTIQSTAPSNLLPTGTHGQAVNNSPALPHSASSHHTSSNQTAQGVQFSHQFPTSPPASALPSHLAPLNPSGNPTTYSAATANNLLTDNASILTLASSSKRRRRRSMDTDASVRALAPSSLWGGSRESLPLSVLSNNISEPVSATTPGLHQGRPSLGGITSAERASVYSASGVAPALTSERNSYYAGKQALTTDGSSIKSGFLGHGRNDSITGSIGGPSSPLASPRESSGPILGLNGRLSRKNSAPGEKPDERHEDEKADHGSGYSEGQPIGIET